MDFRFLALAIGAFYGLTGVILGATGAHALKKTLNPDQLEAFSTGTKFQMYHALLLILVGLLYETKGQFWLNNTIAAIAAGTLCFSGSIYLLTVFRLKAVWFVTPLGGLLLIIGWTCLLIWAIKTKGTAV